MARRNKRGGKVNATGRNVYDRFVLLPHYLLRCAAWKTLSPNAKALLIDVWAKHNGANNGDIAYAVREAEEIGLAKSVAARAFQELTDRGFLKLHKASTFNLKTKEARTWELTAEPVGNTSSSKDFMRWSPDGQKAKRQSPQRDTQSPQRDRKTVHATTLPTSVPPEGLSLPECDHPQSPQRDTCNIPSRLQPDGRTDQPNTTPTEPELQPPAEGRDETHAAVPPAPHQRRGAELPRPKPPLPLHPVALPIGPATAAAMRARVESQQQPATHDLRQVDIEDLLGGKAISSVPPVDQLRTDLARHLDSAPRGEVKRIAAVLGLSGPQISNFKAGRFNLNSTAEAVLRQYLNEARQGGAAA